MFQCGTAPKIGLRSLYKDTRGWRGVCVAPDRTENDSSSDSTVFPPRMKHGTALMEKSYCQFQIEQLGYSSRLYKHIYAWW